MACTSNTGCAQSSEQRKPTVESQAGTRHHLKQAATQVFKGLQRTPRLLLYRGWGIACADTQVYAPRYREEWLSKIAQAGVRRRAVAAVAERSLHSVAERRRRHPFDPLNRGALS